MSCHSPEVYSFRTYFSPIWSAHLVKVRTKSGKMTIEEGIRHKKCSGCKEHLPADTEFYSGNRCNTDGLENLCKCCYVIARGL